jgi:CheY-like chemotaxis protein
MTAPRFIVIDDSRLNCLIAEKVIQQAGCGSDVRSFLMATDALAHIRDTPPVQGSKTIVLIDIQMPVMDGFEFVEAFGSLPEQIRSRYELFILSSSDNETDKNRAAGFGAIRDFIHKPLTTTGLHQLTASLQKNASITG